MVFPRRVLHLTVDEQGQVSCWDDRERAMLGKQKHEVYLPLLLTLAQTADVKESKRAAKKNKNGR